jgi:pimeloyl-ACP methyl ester carboxylesterase
MDSVDQLQLGDVTRLLFASLTSAIPEQESRGARSLLGELLYFMDGSVRCAATRRLDAVVRPALAAGRPVVIVAYSMGAVVAHDYLSSLPVKNATIHLITAGSPLGMREFRELLFGVGAAGPRKPASVATWTNVYDPDDPFSAPVGAAAVVDRRVEQPYGGSAHYHGRYLRDPATGRAILEALRGN